MTAASSEPVERRDPRHEVFLYLPVPIPETEQASGHALVVGLVASPGAACDLAAAMLPGLPDRLGARVPGVRWSVKFVRDRLLPGPASLTQLVWHARRRMLDEGWHLTVCVTDLPLQSAGRPVVAHASRTHGAAVLSLPALGPVSMARRAPDAVVRLVAALLGDTDPADGQPDSPVLARRVRELSARVEADASGFGLVTGVATGNLRLLLGMLRANRPWRLAIRLSRALVAALAAGVFALVTSDIWRLADRLGSLRLSLLAVGSVVAVVLVIVVGAGLWERVPAGSRAPTDSAAGEAAREQVILFNVVTVATVVIGVLALYLALLALTLLGTWLLVPNGLLADTLGHPAGVTEPLKLAWLASSIATVAGALGAGLETDEAVREAAYGYQPDGRLSSGG